MLALGLGSKGDGGGEENCFMEKNWMHMCLGAGERFLSESWMPCKRE